MKNFKTSMDKDEGEQKVQEICEELQLIIEKNFYNSKNIYNNFMFEELNSIKFEMILRKERNKLFRKSLFADPAWDMLLDLYEAFKRKEKVTVSSLCIASNTPPTTALRWIKVMVDDGLFERSADPNDRRKIHIKLSAKCLHTMWLLEQSMQKKLA